MNGDKINEIYKLLDSIEVTEENKDKLENIKRNLENGELVEAFEKIKSLNMQDISSQSEVETEQLKKKSKRKKQTK